MKLRLAVVALVVGLGVSLVPGGAGAQEVTTGNVSSVPANGLVDGQIVTVQGSEFVDTSNGGSLTVALCPGDILDHFTLAPQLCGATIAFPVSVDDADHFTTPLQVFRTQPVFDGPTQLNCLTPVGCAVFAIEVVIIAGRPLGAVIAATPVTFRATKFSDCSANTRQFVTDAKGRPFRSSLACIGFVLRQRPRR